MMEIKIDLPQSDGSGKSYDDLFNVWVLDYGDNYHKRDDKPMSDLERDVRKLKGRYRDVISYNQALIIYNEWMEFLAEKYGDHSLLKKMIKNGIVDDYIPRKPRLKNNKTLKYLYKHKIIVSPVSNGRIQDEDEFEEFVDNFWFPGDDESADVTVTVQKDKLANELASEYDTSPYFKSQTFVDDAQYLERYFASKNKPKKNKKKSKKKEKVEPILIGDVIAGCYDPTPDEDESDNSYMTPYGSLLLTSGRTKEMELYRRLNDAGWNSYKIMKNAKYSKREINMFKPIKKAKKNKKKTKKMMKNLGVEDTLVQIFEDMGYDDFEDYRKEMLSMTSDDVFKY